MYRFFCFTAPRLCLCFCVRKLLPPANFYPPWPLKNFLRKKTLLRKLCRKTFTAKKLLPQLALFTLLYFCFFLPCFTVFYMPCATSLNARALYRKRTFRNAHKTALVFYPAPFCLCRFTAFRLCQFFTVRNLLPSATFVSQTSPKNFYR